MSVPIVFPQDVQVNKPYPSLEYNGTETGASWREERSIQGTMIRAVNAQYNDITEYWHQVDNSQPSNALAHYPDGTIAFLFMPPSTTSDWPTAYWQGFDQRPVYHAVTFGLTDTDTGGSTNTAALNSAVAAVVAAGGGTLLLPAGTYYINGSITISGTEAGLVIRGVSGQTRLIQNAAADMFDVMDTKSYQGVRFLDLFLSYAPFDPGTSTYVAVNVTSSDAVTCERVHFDDCPRALQTDAHSDFCGLQNCWVHYNLRKGAEEEATVDNQTMVSLSGAEGFIANCVIAQEPVNNSESPGPKGCTGVVLAGDNAARFISNAHISDFAVGLQINEGRDAFCTGVRIDAYQNAVSIVPAAEDDTIYGVHFANCTFANTVYGNTLGNLPTSGVLVSTNGGSTSSVSGIYFANCDAFGWANAGIEIDSGSNIAIVGGQYSSNGQAPSEDYLGAGIAVAAGGSQGADEVTISGVDCSGTSGYWEARGQGMVVAQPFGIALSGLVIDVTISGCNLLGDATGAVLVVPIGENTPTHVYIRDCNARGYLSYGTAMNVISSASDIQITDCAGYNDAGVTLVGPIAPPATSFKNATYGGYRGPVTFYVWGPGATSVEIGSLSVGLGTGSFLLPCGVSAKVNYIGSPDFAIIGM